MATLENATPCGDFSHQECSGSCRDEGIPLPWRGKPKSQDRVGRDWISRGITEGPSNPTLLWGIAIGPVGSIWKKWARRWGWINCSHLKCHFVLLSFEFLPCYDRSSLFYPSWIESLFSYCWRAQEGFGAPQYLDPSRSLLSPPCLQQSPPILLPIWEKDFWELLPACKTSAFTIYAVVMGVAGDLIGLTRLIMFDTLCVPDLGPLLNSFRTLCIQSRDWFLVSFIFQGPVNWINCSRVNGVLFFC